MGWPVLPPRPSVLPSIIVLLIIGVMVWQCRMEQWLAVSSEHPERGTRVAVAR
ncbi:MAG: hypothetical protein ACRDTH_19865 [Pseudonocardiaceae bacterium]